jgi:tRNA (guanine-N7-)-methyltransferase
MQATPVILNIDLEERLSPETIFGRNAPLEVDLGCGKGRFLSVHASRVPEHDFIGIERKLKRVIKVERKAERLELQNVRMIRIEAAYFVERILPDACLSVLYIFYPDPWPKRKHLRRRLFSPTFMDSLVRVLTPDGIVHLATDHADYFEHMTKVVSADSRFIAAEPYVPDEEERSEFETTFRKLGQRANRLSFRPAPQSK